MPLFVLSLMLLISTPCFSQTGMESPDQIWEVGDCRWTVEEEHRFEKWVDETVTEDFFIRYGLPTDCADAVYAIRWIYARIAHLPAAATTREGQWIGHWSTDWKQLPTDAEWHKDERFRAALLYLFPKTWTGTLPFDTYPVRISPDSITPGTLFLEKESHVAIIGHVFLDGSQAHPLQIWESALPVKIQKLSLKYFSSGTPDYKSRSGFVRFRWPVPESGGWKYLPIEGHPFYSEEQYTNGFRKGYASFSEAVSRKIDPANYSPKEKMVKLIGTVTRLLTERVPVVLAGYQQCRNGGCPEASQLWEVYSTRGRDGMIISLMNYLSRMIESDHLDQEMVKRMMEAVRIDISEDQSVTLDHIYRNYLWLSPHPEDSIEARWGLKKCERIRAEIRTTNKSIAFIEKTYRKRDPGYADFSIRQQRYVLRGLNEEWNKSACSEPLPTREKKAKISPPKVAIEPRPRPKECERINAEIRATNDSIIFIEKTYRKKDPEYADFSIRQQQHILQRLDKEWTSSQCGEAARR